MAAIKAPVVFTSVTGPHLGEEKQVETNTILEGSTWITSHDTLLFEHFHFHAY